MRDATLLAAILLLLTVSLAPSRGQSGTGAIEGRVTFHGAPPPPSIIGHDGSAEPVLHVGSDGGLRYAAVFLPDARPATTPVPAEARLNQRRFVFEPQVLAVRAGQTVRFTNDDPASHNVRSRNESPPNTFSITTAAGAGVPHVHRFAPTRGDRPLELSCDIHPWMAAWIYVFEHDLFAVTAAGGTFTIADVPAGRHRLAVRQPSGPLARDLAVDVRGGQTTRLDVRFTASDLGMPSR